MKTCLVLGVRLFPGAIFEKDSGEPRFDEENGCYYWNAIVHKKGKEIPEEFLEFNVLIGADGENSNVADYYGFERY